MAILCVTWVSRRCSSATRSAGHPSHSQRWRPGGPRRCLPGSPQLLSCMDCMDCMAHGAASTEVLHLVLAFLTHVQVRAHGRAAKNSEQIRTIHSQRWAFGLAHLLALLVPNQSMKVDLFERSLREGKALGVRLGFFGGCEAGALCLMGPALSVSVSPIITMRATQKNRMSWPMR